MAYDPDELVCPPQPKPAEDDLYRQFREQYEADERKRQLEAAKQRADYERRSRDYKISESAATGGDPYEGEE